MTTLRERLDVALFPIERPDFFENALEYYEIIEKTVSEWLEEKRKELFIETVSTMDCEMSGVREETFEELLADLSVPKQVSRVEINCVEKSRKVST